ncbi:hypothetical protein CAPTEDRAFT_193655, partial [Capitella teleta]
FVQEPCSNRIIQPGVDGPLYGLMRPRIEGAYLPNHDCSIKIQAPKYNRLVVRFRRIDIYKVDKNCLEQDAVVIRGNTSDMVFCGSGTPSYSILSSSDFLTVNMITGSHNFENERIGFELYYTVFHEVIDNRISELSVLQTMTAEFAAANGGQTTIHIQSGNTVVNVNGASIRESQYDEPPPPYTYTSMGLYDPTDTERDPSAPPAYDNVPMTSSENTQSPEGVYATINEADVTPSAPPVAETETATEHM